MFVFISTSALVALHHLCILMILIKVSNKFKMLFINKHEGDIMFAVTLVTLLMGEYLLKKSILKFLVFNAIFFIF